MPHRCAGLLIALVLLPAAVAQAVPAGPVIGMGEQKAGQFHGRPWKKLALRDVRYIAPWDAIHDPAQLAQLDRWMAGARQAHLRVLLGFAHSMRNHYYATNLPTVRQFDRAFLEFRARYPWVKDYLVWNEANNGHSVSKNQPRRIAQYYNAVVRDCFRCNIVGADVLDTSNMGWWVSRFWRAAKVKPKIWGLHNYVDANHFWWSGTKKLLSLVRGQIWFTETGGVVLRRVYNRHHKVVRIYRYGVKRAALATAHIFQLACLSQRITRVYLYHWRAPSRVTNWDSGLLDKHGRPRPAYNVVRNWLARTAQASRRGGRRALCAGQVP
jgi:hypothetical protein